MRSLLPAALLLVLTAAAQAQFLSLPQYDNGVNLNSFVQADINGDGKSDIVGIRSVAPPAVEITVLLGNGTGGFDAALNTTITGVDNVAQPYQFRLADFNGDGRLDVAVFGTDHVTGQPAIAVLLGNGNGTFQAGRETVLGNVGLPAPTACSFNAADYNEDGKVDIAYVSASKGTLNVLLGKNDGTFSTPLTTSLGASAFECLATGDFNNDKKLDLAAATSVGNISMLLGNGNGTFQSPVVVGRGGTTIVPATLTTNSNLDLVALQTGSPPAITVLLGDGTGHFPTRTTYNGPTGYSYYPPVGVRDLNGDGHADLVVLSGPVKSRVVTILLNNGSGSFSPGKTYNADGVNGVGINSGLLAADLNGDKEVDLAFSNGTGGISVLLGNGNGTFKGNFAAPSYGTDVQVGEFNGDVKPDLALPNSSSTNTLLGNGDGSFTVKQAACNFESLAIGLFNSDAKQDLAGPAVSSGLAVTQVCLGNGNGTFTAGGNFDQGVQHRSVAVGEFTTDGKQDLAESDQNGISVLLGNGDGTFQNGIPTSVNASYPNFALGDFNHDGKLDVAAVTLSGIAVYLGNDNGTFTGPIISAGPDIGYLTATDLNKDGKLDLVVAGEGGPVTVLLGKGDGTFQAPVQYTLPGSGSTRAVIGDFNIDGHLDVAVGTLSGVVGVFFGDGTGKLSAKPTTFRVADAIGGLATSDFNNDTKPDLAVVEKDGYVVTLLHQ